MIIMHVYFNLYPENSLLFTSSNDGLKGIFLRLKKIKKQFFLTYFSAKKIEKKSNNIGPFSLTVVPAHKLRRLSWPSVGILPTRR